MRTSVRDGGLCLERLLSNDAPLDVRDAHDFVPTDTHGFELRSAFVCATTHHHDDDRLRHAREV